jgi:phosphoglycolate phosphatase-like HAD superfamily hydrolase
MTFTTTWLPHITCIVSDFDDTFMRGSEGVKRDTWKLLFSDTAQYERYLVAQAEVSRTGKGGRRYIIAHTLMCEDTSEQVGEYEKKFDEMVQSQIIRQGIADADLKALQTLHARGYLVYLMSGTPQEALRRTVRDLSIRHDTDLSALFESVLGQPNTKTENFALIQSQTNIPYSNMVKVGDSQADLAAAESVGAHFIGVTTKRNEEMWRDRAFPKVAHFSELANLFQKNGTPA